MAAIFGSVYDGCGGGGIGDRGDDAGDASLVLGWLRQEDETKWMIKNINPATTRAAIRVSVDSVWPK